MALKQNPGETALELEKTAETREQRVERLGTFIPDPDLVDALMECYSPSATAPAEQNYRRRQIDERYVNSSRVVMDETDALSVLEGTIYRDTGSFTPPQKVLENERKAGVTERTRVYWQTLAEQILKHAEAELIKTEHDDKKTEDMDIWDFPTDVARAIITLRRAKPYSEEERRARQAVEELMKKKRDTNPYQYGLLKNNRSGPIRVSGAIQSLQRLVGDNPVQNIETSPTTDENNTHFLRYQVNTSHPKFDPETISDEVAFFIRSAMGTIRRTVEKVLGDSQVMKPLLRTIRTAAMLNQEVALSEEAKTKRQRIERTVTPEEQGRFLDLMRAAAKMLGHPNIEIGPLPTEEQLSTNTNVKYEPRSPEGRQARILIAYPDIDDAGKNGTKTRMRELARALALHHISQGETDHPEEGTAHQTLADEYVKRTDKIRVVVTTGDLGNVQLSLVQEQDVPEALPVTQTQVAALGEKLDHITFVLGSMATTTPEALQAAPEVTSQLDAIGSKLNEMGTALTRLETKPAVPIAAGRPRSLKAHVTTNDQREPVIAVQAQATDWGAFEDGAEGQLKEGPRIFAEAIAVQTAKAVANRIENTVRTAAEEGARAAANAVASKLEGTVRSAAEAGAKAALAQQKAKTPQPKSAPKPTAKPKDAKPSPQRTRTQPTIAQPQPKPTTTQPTAAQPRQTAKPRKKGLFDLFKKN